MNQRIGTQSKLIIFVMIIGLSCIGCSDEDDFYTPEGADVDFYGKVVDQNNDPIPGYEIDCTLRTFFVAPQIKYPDRIRSKIITDSQGKFSFHNKGYQLLLDFQDAPGYEFIYAANPKTSFGYDHVALPDSFEASESNPFVFTLRKKGKPAFLIGTGRDRYSIGILWEDILQALDMSVYQIGPWRDANGLPGYLPGDDKVDMNRERQGPKDLRIQGQLSQDETQFNLEITPLVENSGILVSESLLYEAPDEGYQASIQVAVPRGQDWKRYIYLKWENGKFFQRSLLKIYIDRIGVPNASMNLSMENWINPEGSRNLEYDKEYLSQEEEWRYLLHQLRFLQSKGDIKTLKAKKLVEDYGLAYLPEWKTEEQFFNEMRQLRAQKDAQNPQWWHKLEKKI